MTNYRRARYANTYFFTVVTDCRRRILCSAEARAALRSSIHDVRKERPFQIAAWVLLPDHLHCIWKLPEGDSDYSTRWALIKIWFSKRMKPFSGELRISNSKAAKRESGIWQRRFWEHVIRDDDDFLRHCDYIHWNPVKHGLAERPADWHWSTIHKFMAEGLYEKGWGEAGEVLTDIPGDEYGDLI